MAYIKNSNKEIGNWVTTTKEHSSMVGKFTKGSRVKIVDIDPMRGYAIEDEFGNKLCECGWTL